MRGFFLNLHPICGAPNPSLHYLYQKKMIMKNPTLALLAALSLLACGKNERTGSGVFESGSQAPPMENLNVQAEYFEEIDSTGVLIFPLSMGQNTDSRDSAPYKDLPEDLHWNLLFVNTQTHEQHLLTDKKILLNTYNYKYERENSPAIPHKSDFIFYTAETDDFNKDKILTSEDPIYLFVSDRSGNHFRQISPKNMRIGSWALLAGNKVVMTAYRDSNKNRQFDPQDESAVFEVILNQDETPKEVITATTKATIKKLYDRDWKKVK